MSVSLLKVISLKNTARKTLRWLKKLPPKPKRNEGKCEAINGACPLVIMIIKRGLKICLENCKYESGKSNYVWLRGHG